MKFFLDTADIKDVEALLDTGMIDGITTNPSLIAKSGQKFEDVIARMCELVSGPVSAEVMGETADQMVAEGQKLADIAKNVCIKVPLTPEGLKACHRLSAEKIDVNVTLCFSAAQALLAAKAGAKFISPFIGRLDDLGSVGLQLIRDIIQIYDNFPNLKTEILAASIRSTQHVTEAAKMGADVATMPPKIFNQLYAHPLTDKGIAIFEKDWKAAQKPLQAVKG
ncbi:fructose-6-phosphate aldolase [Alphaproteobacteria bacterium]|nr:fructose-6-phosphate aldolase [Alphaproteobacteria bacterium]